MKRGLFSLSALFLDSWFKSRVCQDQEETHFYSFLGALLKEIRRSTPKASSEMVLAESGRLGGYYY